MWMPAQTTMPPFATRGERRRHELADRREDDRRVELLRRRLVRPPAHSRRARARTPAPPRRPARVKREDAPALVARDLRDDVRRGAEAVEAEPLRVAREPQRAVADQPGAEQRRRLHVGVAVRDREAEALVGDRVLRVAAVEVVAGEARAVAEVLAARAAVAARRRRSSRATARRARSAAARRPLADDLVAGHERQLRVRQLAVDDVQIGAAHAAGVDAHQHLPRPRLGNRQLGENAAAGRPPRGASRARR